jgi:hypothetical protein
MLRRILQELETIQGPVDVRDLARRLNVEPGALAGMIEFWVRKGRLKNYLQEAETAPAICNGSHCGGVCPGPQACAFASTLPQTRWIALQLQAKDQVIMNCEL